MSHVEEMAVLLYNKYLPKVDNGRSCLDGPAIEALNRFCCAVERMQAQAGLDEARARKAAQWEKGQE